MTTPTEGLQSPRPWRAIRPLLHKERVAFALRDRVFVFGVFGLASLQTVFFDEAFFLLGLALAGALATYVPVVEWFQGTDPMLHSLPVGRNAVVVARYVVALVAGWVAGIAWAATGQILLPVLMSSRNTPGMWMSLDGVLTFVVAAGLMFSLFFPLYFRFGMARGAVAFMGTSLALLVLGYATATLAGGPAAAGAAGLFPPSALISTRVVAMVGALGPAGTLTIILLSLALVFAGSLTLSQRWFQEREF